MASSPLAKDQPGLDTAFAALRVLDCVQPPVQQVQVEVEVEGQQTAQHRREVRPAGGRLADGLMQNRWFQVSLHTNKKYQHFIREEALTAIDMKSLSHHQHFKGF